MIPAVHNITLLRGAAFGETLTFVQSSDGVTPIDLTDASPFTAQVRDNSRSPVLVTLTVTDVDLENGVLTLTTTPEQTVNLPVGRDARWDLKDSSGYIYMYGTATLSNIITES
jgi:hypothetical protein